MIGGTHSLNLEDHGRLECAAIVLASLMYPDRRPGAAFDRTYDALCRYLIQVRAESDGEWAHGLQLIRPVHALVAPAAVARIQRDMATRLPKALWTGFIATKLLKDGSSSEDAKASVEGLTSDLAAKLEMTDTNLKARAWRPWLPVVHLCVAYSHCHLTASDRQRAFFELVRFLLGSDQALLAFARLAEDLEPTVVAEPRIPIRDDDLVRVRIAHAAPDQNSSDL